MAATVTYVVVSRDTESSTNKGTVSLQTHQGQTTRQTDATPAGSTVERTDKPEATATTTNKGDTVETRTSTGVGNVASSTTEDTRANEGMTIKFSIPIQQKNPVTLSP